MGAGEVGGPGIHRPEAAARWCIAALAFTWAWRDLNHLLTGKYGIDMCAMMSSVDGMRRRWNITIMDGA